MENNTFEELEVIETTNMKSESEVKTQKEYEKLLLMEANRADLEKAKNLIKCGCFEQVKEDTLNFGKLQKIKSDKKYKGLYDLYRDLETMQLVFVCPLVENNKGDADENKSMKPYAYDCLYIEYMDNETYQMVMAAARKNLNSSVKVGYIASFVLYALVNVVAIINWVFNFIDGVKAKDFFYGLTNASYACGAAVAVGLCSTPLLVLMMIKYRKYKDQ